jgi:hypothetical protein
MIIHFELIKITLASHDENGATCTTPANAIAGLPCDNILTTTSLQQHPCDNILATALLRRHPRGAILAAPFSERHHAIKPSRHYAIAPSLLGMRDDSPPASPKSRDGKRHCGRHLRLSPTHPTPPSDPRPCDARSRLRSSAWLLPSTTGQLPADEAQPFKNL